MRKSMIYECKRMNIMSAARARALTCVMGLLLLAVPWTVVSAAGDSEDDPSVAITISPEQDYYDVFENESGLENVTVRFEAENIDDLENLSGEWGLWAADYPGYSLAGMSYSHTEASSFNLSWFAGWSNNTEYEIGVWIYRIEGEGESLVKHELANDTISFTIGQEPEPQPLVNLGLTCALDDDNVWDMMLEDYGSYAPDHPTAIGILECTILNPNGVPVTVNFSMHQTGLPQGAGFASGFASGSVIQENGAKPLFVTLDCGEPSSCVISYPDVGKITINVEIYTPDLKNWSSNSTSFEIYYAVGENVTVPAPVPGCMDEEATNYNVNATVDDGSCTYPIPVPPTCLLCNFTTDIPSNVSVNTSATFSADATGTEGWDFYGGESVYWNFNGTITQGSVVEHTYTSMPEGGTTNVTVCVKFIQGPESCHTEIITVNETLTGYVSHSSQLQSVTLVGGSGVYFSANALGGLAPYSYDWQFGDGTSSTNESLVHEYSEPGVYNVSVVITDARADNITLSAKVEILEFQKVVPEEDVDTGDAEETLGDVEPLSVALAGGGTLALILLTGYNGRKSRDKMMLKAQHKAQKKNVADADSVWEDDFP